MRKHLLVFSYRSCVLQDNTVAVIPMINQSTIFLVIGIYMEQNVYNKLDEVYTHHSMPSKHLIA